MTFMQGPGHASFCGNKEPHEKHRHPEADSYSVCGGIPREPEPAVISETIEDVLTDVLVQHQRATPPVHDLRPRCTCGSWVSSDMMMPREFARHQRKAVVEALTSAGVIQWGEWTPRGVNVADSQLQALLDEGETVYRIVGSPWIEAV